MTWTFLHAADVHLDSPMLELDNYEGAPVAAFRSATREAMSNLVELAIKSEARFVLFAGDLYDGECKNINTAIAFRIQLQELSNHKIKSFIVQGNHDAASRVTKAFGGQLPEGVHLFSTKKAETETLGDLSVAIHGQGFDEAAVTEDLSRGYPDPVPGMLNVGLLHTNCIGSAKHGNYSPTTVDRLAARGYDYWALGHVHDFQVLRSEDPWIVYPGNLQGRHIREQGAKGCVRVTVDGGSVIEVEHVPLDVTRWAECKVDASERCSGHEVVAQVAESLTRELELVAPRKLAVRLRIFGASDAHRELALDPMHWQTELREMVATRFEDRVWLEKIRFNTKQPVDQSSLNAREDALGDLWRQIQDLSSVDDALDGLRTELEDMQASWPRDPRLDSEPPDGAPPNAELADSAPANGGHPMPGRWPHLGDATTRAELLDDVKQLLLARLLTSGGES